MLYEDATPALARLAGNTAASKKFLTQTGTGSISAVPAWGAIAASDISSGTLAIVNGGTNASTAATALTSLGAVPKAGGTMTGWLAPAVVTLTDASSITVNAALGNDFRLTLTATGHTVANPSNPVDGQAIRFAITSGGSFSLGWGTAYDFGAAGSPGLSSTAGKVDVVGFAYHAALGKWLALGVALSF